MLAPTEIKTYRKLLNLTQVDLAAESGTTQGQISLIERGIISPTAETLGKLTEYLAVAVNREVFIIHEGDVKRQVQITGTTVYNNRTIKFFDGGYIVIVNKGGT